MIAVTFFEENGSVTRVRACGHGGVGEHGSDILCAAVSALVQTAYLAIKDMGCDVQYVRDTEVGLFEFSLGALTDAQRHDTNVVLRALRVGIDDIQSGYPRNIKTEVKSCL